MNPFLDQEEQKENQSSNSFDFSFEKLGISCPGGRIIAAGSTSYYNVDKFKLKGKSSARIAFVFKELAQYSTHWNEHTQNFICTGGTCCSVLGKPFVRNYGIIINYKNIDYQGNIVGDFIDYSLEIIQLGNKNYESLLAVLDNPSNLCKNDLYVTCSDEKFQSYSFKIKDQHPAAWYMNEKVRRDVFNKIRQYGNTIWECVGKNLKEEQIREFLKDSSSPQQRGMSQENPSLSSEDLTF